MRKISVIGYAFFIILLLTACANEENEPSNRLASYIELWTEEQWGTMYDEYITTNAKEKFGTEQFIERTEKIYKDLNVTSVAIHTEELTEQKKYNKDEVVTLPVQIIMDTVAGEIEFTKEIPFVYEEIEKEKNWYIDWNPSFILPNLTKEDKIGITKVPFQRGEIYDRNENPLAINGSGAEVGIVAGSFNIDNAQQLANLLGTTANYIQEQLNQSWIETGHFVPIKKIPFTQQTQYEQALQIPGVTAVKADMREYPYASALAHLVGYVGPVNAEELEKLKEKGYKESDIVGKRGLEQLLEERLRGEDGIEVYIEKADDREERTTIAEKPAVNGESISITIDADFQKTIYDEMNGDLGTAAVVHSKTGETLALVSSPAFDPNELALGVTNARYTALTEDPTEPMLNRFSATYAPGSTIKPITAAIGLTAGTLKPEEGHTITGDKWQKDRSWGAYRVSRVYQAPNPIDLRKALIYSDNIYFAKEALKLKQNELIKGLEQYGFGEDIPFTYHLRASQISNDEKLNSEGQLIDTSFGQGQMLMNILHLASTYESILNDGTLIKPILFTDEEKGEVWKEGLLSSEHAKLLKENLRAVVTDGLADGADIESPKISGKTGTAELKSSREQSGKENGFFVAYPTDTEDYIIAMMIENVENRGGSNYVMKRVANVMKAKK